MPKQHDTRLESLANAIVSIGLPKLPDLMKPHQQAELLTNVLMILDRTGVTKVFVDQIATVMRAAYHLGQFAASQLPAEVN